MTLFLIITGGLFPIYVLDYDASPGRAAAQALVLLMVLGLAWRMTRGAWLVLRLFSLAVAYGCANAGFLFAVAGYAGDPNKTLYYLWPVLVAGAAGFYAGSIWFARLTVPQTTSVRLEVQK